MDAGRFGAANLFAGGLPVIAEKIGGDGVDTLGGNGRTALGGIVESEDAYGKGG